MVLMLGIKSKHKENIKGTVSVILSDLPFVEWQVLFTRVPINLCLIKDFLDILIYIA